MKNNILTNNPTKAMHNYGHHKINYQKRFPSWDGFFSGFLAAKIIGKEIWHKLITLISMYHLKPLVSLDRFIKNWNADVQIAVCTDTVIILCITILHRIIFGRFLYFEDAVTHFDKIVIFSREEKQINMLKFI